MDQPRSIRRHESKSGDPRRGRAVALGNALALAYDSLRVNKVRTGLTALGMAIGTGAAILVVTIALTSRDYVLAQIQQIGSNTFYVRLEGADTLDGARSRSDELTLGDLEAIRERVPYLQATAAVTSVRDRLWIGQRARDVTVLGATPELRVIRNLRVLTGRFFDAEDEARRNKVCLITEPLAAILYPEGWVEGSQIKVFGVEFTIIGVFREEAETFGQSEISRESVLLPVSVIRLFTGPTAGFKIYATTALPSQVPEASRAVMRVIRERHRGRALYGVGSMMQLLAAADKIAIALTIVLVLVSAIALIVSGIGIMNIMLVTVTERTPEIGLRMALGATRHDIRSQFLTEALLLSLGGGMIGILAGAGIPFVAQYFAEGVSIPVSWIAIVVAVLVSLLCGVVFGIIPAERASRLSVTDAFRQE